MIIGAVRRSKVGVRVAVLSLTALSASAVLAKSRGDGTASEPEVRIEPRGS